MGDYKFKSGEVFKLKPTARVTWLTFANHTGSGITAVRCDSEAGKKLIAWIAADKPEMSYADQHEMTKQVSAQGRDFWPHDLETAVKQ
jgi:hypothetical protein